MGGEIIDPGTPALDGGTPRERVDSREVKDAARKITPYLVPYDQLSEEIKEKDRDVIRNIPALLERIGMAANPKEPVPWF